MLLTAAAALHVRPATADDLAAVAAIYNDGIRGRGATFETAERSADDIRNWISRSHPLLVATATTATDAPVLGWIRASTYRERDVYRSIAEFSVYVASSARGRRVGDALMHALIPACANAGITKLVSRIFPENSASRALCARHGFREVGTYERHGKLDGVWRDVIIVELLLPENMR
jgi:phosphinothricin acetyltransferase